MAGLSRAAVITDLELLRDAQMTGLEKLHRGVRRPGECLLWAVHDATELPRPERCRAAPEVGSEPEADGSGFCGKVPRAIAFNATN